MNLFIIYRTTHNTHNTPHRLATQAHNIPTHQTHIHRTHETHINLWPIKRLLKSAQNSCWNLYNI